MLDFLFWLAMAAVLVLGYEDWTIWLAVRKFRKQVKEYEREHSEDRDVPHL